MPYHLPSAEQRLQGWSDAGIQFFPYLLPQGAGLLAKLLTGSEVVSYFLPLGHLFPPMCTECVPFCPRSGTRCKQDQKGPCLSLSKCATALGPANPS